MKLKVYIGLFWVVLLASCETIIEYELPESETKLVMNTVFNQDSVWVVQLSESKNILDTGNLKKVSGAIVNLSDNQGNTELLIHQGNGVYKSTLGTVPQLGVEYIVTAEKPGFEAIEASGNLPSPVAIIDIDTTPSLRDGYNYYDTRVRFKDPAGERNYYSLEVYFTQQLTLQYDSIIQSIQESYPLYYFSEESEFTDNLVYTFDAIYFSDDLFDGQTYQLKVNVERPYLYEEPPFFIVNSAQIDYRLKSISEELYLYERSRTEQSFSSFDPFAQPAQVFSNIENGFGIFAGYSTDTYSIVLK